MISFGPGPKVHLTPSWGPFGTYFRHFFSPLSGPIYSLWNPGPKAHFSRLHQRQANRPKSSHSRTVSPTKPNSMSHFLLAFHATGTYGAVTFTFVCQHDSFLCMAASCLCLPCIARLCSPTPATNHAKKDCRTMHLDCMNSLLALSYVPSPMSRLRKCRLFTPSLQPPYELKPATSLALNAYWKLCHHKLHHPLNRRILHEDSLPSARLHSPGIAHLSSLSAGHFPMQTQPLASLYIAWFTCPLSSGTPGQVIVVLEP